MGTVKLWIVENDVNARSNALIGHILECLAEIEGNDMKEVKALFSRESLSSIFFEYITLDFDFAKSLQLYDIIEAKCFKNEDVISNDLIELSDYCDLNFILHRRMFKDCNRLEIDFFACHQEDVWELHRRLTGVTE